MNFSKTCLESATGILWTHESGSCLPLRAELTKTMIVPLLADLLFPRLKLCLGPGGDSLRAVTKPPVLTAYRVAFKIAGYFA
ncbi:MAG: hypothetical protein QMB92_05810 [Thiopseudomonas sp.]